MENYTVTVDGTTYAVPKSSFKSQREAEAHLKNYFAANPKFKPVRKTRESLGAGDLARVAAQGLTFGAADEIEGRARAAFSGIRSDGSRKSYEEIIAGIRASNDRAYAANPALAFGVELGASAVPTLAAAALTAPAGGAGGAAAAAATAARTGATAARAAGALNKGVQAQRAAGLGRASAIGAGEGALYGFNAAEGDMLQRAPAAAIGAAGGGIMSGASKIVQPQISKAGQRLLDKGAAMSPEMLGKPAQGVLSAMRNTPLVMGPARARQEDTLKAFNTLVGNEVLRPINKTLGKSLEGENAYTSTKTIISKTYDDILSEADDASIKLGNYADVLSTKLDDIKSAGITVDEKTIKKLEKFISNIDVRYSSGSGKDFKKADAELRKLIENLRKKEKDGLGVKASESGDQANLLDAVRDVMHTRASAQIGGDWGKRLRKTDFAYKQLQAIRNATLARGGDGEVFTPKQLRDAVKKGDLKAFLGTEKGPLAQLALDGDEVYGALDYSTARDQATQGMLGLGQPLIPTALTLGAGALGYGAVNSEDYKNLMIGGGALGAAALAMTPYGYRQVPRAALAGGEQAASIMRNVSPYLSGGLLGRMYESEAE